MLEDEDKSNKERNRSSAKLVRDITIIPNHLIDAVWEKAVPHIMLGEKQWRGFYTIDQIRNACVLGYMQLWTEVKGKDIVGVVLTQLDRFPEKLALRFLYLGGNEFEPEMLDQFPKFEQWAIEQGATGVDFLARDGWKKYLPKYGYVPVGTVFRKELVDKNNISKELN